MIYHFKGLGCYKEHQEREKQQIILLPTKEVQSIFQRNYPYQAKGQCS